MKEITHVILGYSPCRVEFIHLNSNRKITVTYAVVLTKKELEAEYDYISFSS